MLRVKERAGQEGSFRGESHPLPTQLSRNIGNVKQGKGEEGRT